MSLKPVIAALKHQVGRHNQKRHAGNRRKLANPADFPSFTEGVESVSSAALRKHFNLKGNCGKTVDCDSLYRYTGGEYSEINDYLRGAEQARKDVADIENIVSAIDKSMDEAPRIPKDMAVFRNIGGKPAALIDLQPGDEFQDKAFVSTTTTGSGGLVPESLGLNLTIIVRKGSKALYTPDISDFPEEKELLLPRNSKFKVLSREGNHLTVELM